MNQPSETRSRHALNLTKLILSDPFFYFLAALAKYAHKTEALATSF
jgi:hypothetical protein